jgi:Vitamin K-dependent gamma-carboxylase
VPQAVKLKARLRDFFFRPSSGEILSALRIVVGAMMLLKALFLLPHLEDLFGEYGYLQSRLMDAIGGENISSWLIKNGFSGERFSVALHVYFVAHILSAFFFMLGYKTKLANVVLWFTQAALFRLGWESVYGIDSYCHNLTFLMIWLPVGRYWSLDYWGNQEKEYSVDRTVGLRLLQIYLCITYIGAGYSKAVGYDWWHEAMWEVLHLREFHHFNYFWMAEVPVVPKLLALSVLFFETFYFIGVWIPKIGKAWVLTIIGMHLGIAVTMGLVLFGLTLALVNAVLFLMPIRYQDEAEELRRMGPSSPNLQPVLA